MLAVVIPTANSEATLAETLAALVPGAAQGIVREAIISDAGSSDATADIADRAGCRWVEAPHGRGAQLACGAAAVRRGEWLMFLEPDAVLDADWTGDIARFIDRVDRLGRGESHAACFRFKLDDPGARARLCEVATALSARLFGTAHACQGLVLSRRFYASLGGHDRSSVFPEAALARRIGRRRLTRLSTRIGRCIARGAPARPVRPLEPLLAAFLVWLRLPGPLVSRLLPPLSR